MNAVPETCSAEPLPASFELMLIVMPPRSEEGGLEVVFIHWHPIHLRDRAEARGRMKNFVFDTSYEYAKSFSACRFDIYAIAGREYM